MKENFIESKINEVIKTTTAARDLLFKDGVIQDHTDDDLSVVKTVIAANKNIVSASIVMLSIHKMEDNNAKN